MTQLKINTWDGERRYMYAHLKLDGYQIRIKRDQAGLLTVLSRRGTDYLEKVKYVPDLQHPWAYMACNAEVWGELWYPGRQASYVATALRKQDPNLRFSAFCTPTLQPAAPLSMVKDWVDEQGFQFAPYYVQKGYSLAGAKDSYVNPKGLPSGEDIEGYVLKNGNMWEMARFKPFKTIDVIIHDYKDGKGKNEFMVGSIAVRTTEGHIIANVSGMDDDIREEISCAEEKYRGTVIEVSYQSVGDKGKLRHPNFVRFRDDKDPAWCGINQDPALERYYA